MSSGMTDPSAIRSNQAGELTKDQRDAIKSRYSSVSGWITLLIMALLFAGVFVVAGKFLASSTVLGIAAVIVIIIVSAIITSWLGGIVALGRMGNLSVEQASGEVVWKHNQYVADSDGKVLEPIMGGIRDLQPGDYTFYTLRGSNWILSAQASNAPTPASSSAPPDFDALKAILDKPLDFDPAQSPDKAAQRMTELHNAIAQFQNMDPSRLSTADKDQLKGLGLSMASQMKALTLGAGGIHSMSAMAQAFHQATLTPLDEHGRSELERALRDSGATNASALDANRQGQLTGAQRAMLMKNTWTNVLIGLAAMLFGAFALVSAYQKLNWGWGVAGLVGLGVAAAMFVQARIDLGDWAGGRAEMVQAVVGRSTYTTHSHNHSSTTYYYNVNHLRFAVSRPAYEALLEDRTYKVYYSPGAKKFLNIEPA